MAIASKVSEIDRRVSAASNGKLSPGQVVILRVLREAGTGIGRKVLVLKCGLAPPKSAKSGLYSSDWLRILNELESHGLISILRSRASRSSSYLHEITRDGRRLLDEAEVAVAPISLNIEECDLSDDEIDHALQTNRLQFGIVATDFQQAIVRQRRGQSRIHELTLRNYQGMCAVCDVRDPALLIASHVVGWADAPEHRGNLSNVVCLCRIHDPLFEYGYWSLGNDLELLTQKNQPSVMICQILDGLSCFRTPTDFAPAPQFTKRHRERFGL